MTPKQTHAARKNKQLAILPLNQIERSILVLRGFKVMLDEHLAALYQVEVKVLNQAVKRNTERFPPDFMFQLTREEIDNLRSQIVTSSSWGGRRFLPYAFTEQGVAMLSSVLRGDRAAQVNIEIMRAFVRMRRILASHKDLARKIDELERQFTKKTKEHEEHLIKIYRLLDLLSGPEDPGSKNRIGFACPSIPSSASPASSSCSRRPSPPRPRRWERSSRPASS